MNKYDFPNVPVATGPAKTNADLCREAESTIAPVDLHNDAVHTVTPRTIEQHGSLHDPHPTDVSQAAKNAVTRDDVGAGLTKQPV
jgi:hypothetical protein